MFKVSKIQIKNMNIMNVFFPLKKRHDSPSMRVKGIQTNPPPPKTKNKNEKTKRDQIFKSTGF